MRRASQIVCWVLLVTALSRATTPDRANGISMHMLPKGVAELAKAKWGLTIRPSDKVTPDAGALTLQTTKEFLDFVQKQDPSVIENGVWIVTTNPDAYTEMEKKFLSDVIAACIANKIPLFVARAAELPNGWKHYGP